MKTNYFFLHMPKCAGTSIRALLMKQAPFYHTTYTGAEMSMRAELYYRSFLGVGGHLQLRHAYRLGFAQAWKFTFLRDPIQRLISHLTFAAFRNPPVFDLDHFSPSLDPLKKHLADNLLCQATSFHNSFNFFLSTVLDEKSPVEEHIESSITNLRSFEFVGFQETIEADVSTLFSLLALEKPGEIPRENIAAPAAEALKNEILADPECCELVQECTKTDRQIYEAARSWRQERIRPCAELGRQASRLPLPLEIGLPPIQITECTLASPARLSPGAVVVLDVLLELFEPNLLFDLMVTVENSVKSHALLQVFTYHETRSHLGCEGSMLLVNLALPCWLNEGHYVGHIKVYSTRREVIAEKINAFSFQVSHLGSAPRQFGDLYTKARIASDNVTQTRRLSIDEALKLTLALVGGPQIKADGKACSIPLALRNDSSLDISSDPTCRCFISYHLLDQAHKVILFDGPRLALPRIPPGSTYQLVLDVDLFDPKSTKIVQVRILQENVRWHEGALFNNVLLADINLNQIHTRSDVVAHAI